MQTHDDLQIVLIRHGKSALPLRGRITLPEFRGLIEEYNQTGISADSHPDSLVVELGTAAAKVICSDYPRAIDSAKRIAPMATPEVTPLFREAGRPLSWNLNFRFPVHTWDQVSRVCWRFDLFRSDESVGQAMSRAVHATDMLCNAAKLHSRVVAVGHGIFWCLVADELVRRGYSGRQQLQLEHWEAAIYRQTKSK